MGSKASGIKKGTKNNPEASPDEILVLRKKNPKAALAHPNCPIELWWDLAAHYPIEAEDSILFPLATLEDPTRWPRILQENVSEWIAKYGKKMSDADLLLFAADCFERVLPIFEKTHLGLTAPRHALETARTYARKQAGKEDMEIAFEEADATRRRVAKGTQNTKWDNAVYGVAWGACNLTEDVSATSISNNQLERTRRVALGACNSVYYAYSPEAKVAEAEWQANLFLQYVRGNK